MNKNTSRLAAHASSASPSKAPYREKSLARGKMRRPGRKRILLVIGFVVVLNAAFYFVFSFVQDKGPSTDTRYNAIFLDNNQVYFAKIKNTGRKYLTITDVYYFGKDSNDQYSDDITLRKLGSEVHGPTDEMKILEDHILYIEELREDSRVVQAIYEHTSKK